MAKFAAKDSNKNITLSPHGTGKVVVGTGAADATVQSDGNHNLVLQTGNSTTGSISITDGANGDIAISPNGTGTVVVNTDLDVDNINVDGNSITTTNTNGNLTLKPNGTGAIHLNDGDDNEVVKTSKTSSAVNEITVANAATGNGPTLSATGDDTNIDLNISGKGTGRLATTSPKISTNISDLNGNEIIRLTNTSSAQNELNVTNAATGNSPILSATGDDTNIDLIIKPKGTGAILLKDGDGNELINTSRTASAVNGITIGNAATGNGPTLSASGDDTNIDLNIEGKGTGEIKLGSNINFLNDTDAKIKLPSAGGIFESDGSTEILTESSGAVSLKNTILNSNNTFPTGHIIQTLTDSHTVTGPITITTTSDDYLGSNLQITITPKANGNKLFIQALIHGINNNASSGRSLHSGFAYDANFSSGNGTTIGPRAVIADYHNYLSASTGMLGNLQYSTIVTVGTNAPSAGSASIIRPIFQSTTDDITIAANSSAGLGVFSMIVMEIQA